LKVGGIVKRRVSDVRIALRVFKAIIVIFIALNAVELIVVVFH
jgi:hypothetical protein